MNLLQKMIHLRGKAIGTDTYLDQRYQHCRERLRERHAMDITKDEWEQINLAIFLEKEGEVEFVDIGDTTFSSLYKVMIKNSPVLVAFNESVFAMVTVFPRSDRRLFHYIRGSYDGKPLTSAETVFLDRRREVAAQLPTMEVDRDGYLVVEPTKKIVSEPTPNRPFAAALAGFVPKVPEAKTPPPAPAPAPAPVVAAEPAPAAASATAPEAAKAEGENVTGMFARLDSLLAERRKSVSSTAEGSEAKIAELEAQIAAIRDGAKRATLTSKFLESATTMAESAFEQFREGLIDKNEAKKIAHGMFLQLGESGKAPTPTPTTPPVTKLPPAAARGSGRKQLLSKEERRIVAQQAAAKRYGKPVDAYTGR